ncbi:tetratricopeptide repeat protein [Malaciobacter canalis]
MKIKNNIFKIILVSLLALNFTACDDNKSSNKIKSEKKLKLPKPEWDNRLTNYKNTIEWYQLADNDEIAASNIGVIYSDKIKDYKKAIEWYLYSDSIKTDASNIFNLALNYDESKDYNMAIKFYEKAFLLGKTKSAHNLGLIYEEALKDNQNAVKWYKKAIERENINSIKNLGLLYHENLKNDVKASAYYITLIDKRYSKEEVLNLLKNKWKIPNDIIQKGYELQLNSDEFPIKYKGKLDLDE